jgi:hypothetical protein
VVELPQRVCMREFALVSLAIMRAFSKQRMSGVASDAALQSECRLTVGRAPHDMNRGGCNKSRRHTASSNT